MRIIFAAFLIFSHSSFCETIKKIAIIDTGIGDEKSPYLCPSHLNLTNQSLTDQVGHGKYIQEVIETGMKVQGYCILHVKVFTTGLANIGAGARIVEALRLLSDFKSLSHVNMSWSGSEPLSLEEKYIKVLLENKVKVFMAAGNDSLDLDKKCDVFPLCYPFLAFKNFITVGGLDPKTGAIHRASSYGKVIKTWKPIPYVTKFKYRFTGTSAAVPQALVEDINAEASPSKSK